ncbi:MAG: restriction endonuclease [Sandaracinaceae bacterium]|nr:restriction endonuclease [Sandaracinaceae bacterium]
MSIPTYAEFITPLLHVLADQAGPRRAGEIKEAVADRVGLTEEQRQEVLPSGAHARYAHRIGWAQDSTKRHGLTASPSWGAWEITDAGRALLAAHPDGLPPDELNRIARTMRRARMDDLLGVSTPDDNGVVSDEVEVSDESPKERIERAVTELRGSVATDLLERILQAPPEFFETLVLDLLHAMGYGTSRADLTRVGRSGDAGIDGIISLDRLGLEKVYVQAKRWQGSVGRPELQGFFGALAGQRARKGVFITTSHYTRDALEFAQTVAESMVLVDGERLTELMIAFKVGVSHEALYMPRLDVDYFPE